MRKVQCCQRKDNQIAKNLESKLTSFFPLLSSWHRKWKPVWNSFFRDSVDTVLLLLKDRVAQATSFNTHPNWSSFATLSRQPNKKILSLIPHWILSLLLRMIYYCHSNVGFLLECVEDTRLVRLCNFFAGSHVPTLFQIY